MSVQDVSLRPEDIANILAGLERYNPETTSIFQEYVQQQCESRTYDCYANLALLKLCVWPSFLFLFNIFFFDCLRKPISKCWDMTSARKEEWREVGESRKIKQNEKKNWVEGIEMKEEKELL